MKIASLGFTKIGILGVLFLSFLFPLAIFSCLPRLFTNHDMRLFSFVLHA